VVACGRRFGKDVLGQDVLIDKALDGARVAWFAPTYKEMVENFQDVRGLLHPLITRADASEFRLELMTGGIVDMWSLDAHPDAPRGRKYARIVVNEAAKIPSLEYAWTAVLRPTLADYRGDAWFFSTPRGLNYFHALHRMALSSTASDWAAWHYTTHDNPYIDRAEIEAMRRDMPERMYRQEILAEFVQDGAYFQGVEACAVIQERDRPDEHQGHSIVLGVDWGKSVDFSVLTFLCCECSRVVDWEVLQGEYRHQRARLGILAREWGVAGILPERNSMGAPNIEELVASGLPVWAGPDRELGWNMTASNKPLLIEALALALERGEIKVPVEYGDELRAFEVQTRPQGVPRYGAPEGQHDDRVISLALAWQAARQPTGAALIAF
jgi:hypothetical protein